MNRSAQGIIYHPDNIDHYQSRVTDSSLQLPKAPIGAVCRLLIESELTKAERLGYTQRGQQEVYLLDYHNAPNTVMEIARLRELSFRLAGGGTGKELDIDSYDIRENPYQQLILWDPEDKEIVGGYRLAHISDHLEDNKPTIATSEFFHFSDKFVQAFAHKTIELGRSFVQPRYQMKSGGRKSRYALYNLWSALMYYINTQEDVDYYLGKMTTYPDKLDDDVRHLLYCFLNRHFDNGADLFAPYKQHEVSVNIEAYHHLFSGDYAQDKLTVTQAAKQKGQHIPPLIFLYADLTPTMKVCGTIFNPAFGRVEETAILLNPYDLKQSKKKLNFTLNQ